VAVAVGFYHCLALKKDGTVVAWGNTSVGGGATIVPAGLKDVVAIAAGGQHSMALKSDGTVVCWGNNSSGWLTEAVGGQAQVPYGLSGVVSIAGGLYHSIAVVKVTPQIITPKIIWSNPDDIVYGTDLDDKQLNASADVPGNFVYTPSSGVILNAGSDQKLSVQFIPTDTQKYVSVDASVKINVLKRNLSIKAADVSRLYGDPNQNFTANFSGFVPGDDPSVLNGTLCLSCQATLESSVGEYTIIPSGLTSGNYSIEFINGKLSVTQAPLIVTANSYTRQFGQANPAFSGMLSGIKNGDNITASYNCAATSNSPLGEYPIIPVLNDPFGKLNNYSTTIINGIPIASFKNVTIICAGLNSK